MSRDINKTILCGTLGRDPEFKDLDRTRLAKFSIATSDSYDNGTEHKEITTWHEIVVWGKLTDAVGLLRTRRALRRFRCNTSWQTTSPSSQTGLRVLH